MSHPDDTDRIPAAGAPALGADALRAIGLFAGLSDALLDELARTLTHRATSAGEVVFREGDDARAMYVVVQGELDVTKRSRRGGEARVAVLGPGDWFGEMSIFDVQPRSATVRAVAPSRLLEMTPTLLDALYRRDPKSYLMIVLNAARELSRRLRVADALIADFVATVHDEYVRAQRARS